VSDLDSVSETVFHRCTEGDHPLFTDGWTGWPATAKESDVLAWFGGIIPKLEAFASDRIPTPMIRRKLLAQPRTPLIGSTGKRSMDIGFVNSDITYNPDSEDLRYRWSHILVAGELKSNPKADTASIAWIDLARYVRDFRRPGEPSFRTGLHSLRVSYESMGVRPAWGGRLRAI
jgi:hypothetical protein